jgi:hypothetical protein
MSYIDKSKLAELGFSDEIGDREPYAVINGAGLEGTGKTRFGFSMPGPILYQQTDQGEQGVIQQARALYPDKQIIRPRGGNGYSLDIPTELFDFMDVEDEDKKKADADKDRRIREKKLAKFVHENFYVPFLNDFKAGLAAGVRSVVWDTALDVWDYTRLSVYGRHASNSEHLQREANAKYREMVRLANVHKVNLFMINHLKNAWDTYQSDGKTKWRMIKNEYEMQGFDKCPFLVTVNIWFSFSPEDGFKFQIKKMRDDHSWVGQELDACTFPELMNMLVPEVEDWS